MDPTVAHGTVFTCKGSLNHIISNGWKEVVMKEIAQANAWKKKYAKHVLEDEGRLLLMSRCGSSSRSGDASSSQGSLGQTQQSLREDGRSAYLSSRKKISPQCKSTRPLTSSQEVGWRSTPSLGYEVMFEKSSWGRKPIVSADGSSSVESSFKRNCGVF